MALTKIPASLLDTTSGLTVAGDLTVNGTTTTLDSTTLQVADKNIVLNYHASNDTSGAANGAGITIQDAVDGSNDATILWDASNDEFDFSHQATLPGLKLGVNTSLFNQDAAISYYASNNGVYVNGAGTNGWLRLNASGAENARNSIDLYGQAGGDYIKIKAANTDTMYIGANGAGRVGIGTSTPSHALHVVGGDNDEARVRVHNSASGQASLDLDNSEGYFRIFTDGGKLRIYDQTDGTFRLDIDTAGKIGINESTPLGNLHVKSADSGASVDSSADELVVEGSGNSGIQLLSGTSNNGTILFGDSDDSAAGRFRYEHDNNRLNFGTNGAWDRMIIDSAGRVSIGTSTTDRELKVQKSGDHSVIAAVSGTSNLAGMVMGDTSDDDRGAVLYNNSGDYMYFMSNASERMRINSTGEVHITTGGAAIAPTIKHSGATQDVSKLRLINRAGQSSNKGGVVEMGAVTDDGVSRADVLGSVGAFKANATSNNREGYLQFSTSDGATLTERMRIDASGNVGIGETSPAKLGLTGSSNGKVLHLGGDDAQLRLTYTILHHDHSGNTTTTLRNHYGSLDSLARMKLESGYISFHTGTAFNEKMRLNADGRLIIGRTSVIQSDNHLTVSGSGTGAGNAIQDIRNTSTSNTCGCLSLSKASTTTSSANRYIWFFANNFGSNMGAIGGAGLNNVQFIASSDERLKENITPITGSLNKILALNPVSFDWKQNGEHRDAGFVAQEVENVYPEYVITDDDEMKTKNIGGGMTAGFVAELTKAIQEQQTIIEDLKTRIETLEG